MTVTEKLDSILASQSKTETQQAVMCNDMKHIIKDNIEFKNGVDKFKTDYYKTKTMVQKHGVWFAVIQSGITFILGLFGIKLYT